MSEHESGAVQSDVELYDSDRAALAGLVNFLNARHLNHTKDPERFAKEVVERFFAIGFHTEVRIFVLEDRVTGEVAGWEPSIIIEDRVNPEEEFDHDRMRYEVRSDILGMNAQGNIQQKAVGQAGYNRTKSGLIVPGSGPV